MTAFFKNQKRKNLWFGTGLNLHHILGCGPCHQRAETIAFYLNRRLRVNIPGFQPHPEFFHCFRPRLFHRTNGIKSAPMALAVPKTP